MEVIGGLIVFGVIAVFIAIALVGGNFIMKLLRRAEQYDRKRAIQRAMDQEIIDRATERDYAAKLLDKNGGRS